MDKSLGFLHNCKSLGSVTFYCRSAVILRRDTFALKNIPYATFKKTRSGQIYLKLPPNKFLVDLIHMPEN